MWTKWLTTLASGPKPQRPSSPRQRFTPQAWPQSETAGRAAPKQRWWAVYGDSALDGLMDEADLRNFRARHGDPMWISYRGFRLALPAPPAGGIVPDVQPARFRLALPKFSHKLDAEALVESLTGERFL